MECCDPTFLSGKDTFLAIGGQSPRFGHIFTAHAQKLLYPSFRLQNSDIIIRFRFTDPDFLTELSINRRSDDVLSCF